MELELSKLSVHYWEKELFQGDSDKYYQELKDDISERGILTPIQVTGNRVIGRFKPFTIVAGHRRFKAMKELGKDKIPVVVLDALISEQDVNQQFLYDNVLRRELDRLQRVLVYEKLLIVEKEKARLRRIATLKQGNARVGTTAHTEGEEESGRAREKAADKLNKSGKWMDEELKIYEFVKDDSDLLEEFKLQKSTHDDGLLLIKLATRKKPIQKQPEIKALNKYEVEEERKDMPVKLITKEYDKEIDEEPVKSKKEIYAEIKEEKVAAKEARKADSGKGNYSKLVECIMGCKKSGLTKEEVMATVESVYSEEE